jgi:hypothetical protein
MAVDLESLEKLTTWEDYCAFMKERLMQLPDGETRFFVSKKKLDFTEGNRAFKAHAVLAGPKGAIVAKAVVKEGVQFHEGACTASGKELSVSGIEGTFLKEAQRTLKRTRLGYKLAGVEEGDETSEAESEAGATDGNGAATGDPKALQERLAKLETQIKRTITTDGTEPYLAKASARAKEAAGLITTNVTKFLELIEEAEEFARQALAGILEGGDPTEVMQLEAERKELLAEVAEAKTLAEPANDALLKQAEKALDAVVASVGKKDLAKAREFLEAAEGLLGQIAEGPDEAGDPDLTVLDDWIKYRAFLKANLKKVPKEGGPVFISRKPQVFTIKGKEFKGHAILFGGPKVKAAIAALKREGTLFMEGTLKPEGKVLKIGAVKRSLFKGAVKTMIKLRLGRKLVADGALLPEEDETAEDAQGADTGSKFFDKQVKEVAEALIKLRDAITEQRKAVPVVQKVAADKKKEYERLLKIAQDKTKADGIDAATAEWDASDAAKLAADAAQFEAKDADRAAGRAEASLRDLTERLHRIKSSDEPVWKKDPQLKKLKSEIAAKQLDATIANIDPADPKSGPIIADQIKKRFGIKFKLNESTITGLDADGNQIFKDNDKKVDPKKEAETLKQLYTTLAKTPVFPSSKLTKLTVSLRPSNSESEGGVYYEDDKHAEVTCRRPKESFNYSNQLASPDYFPDGVDPDCQPANDDPVSYFDWATLHEVAHAVDAKHKFMGSKMKGTKYGGWADYGQDVGPIATAAADHFGTSLGGPDKAKLRTYAVQKLQAAAGGGPAHSTPEEESVSNWVDGVRAGKGLWWDGGKSKALQLGSRVYQESYEGGWWVSYEAGARKQGIHGYQFRAPGEWFAELYAAYYSDKLKPSHPIVSDLTQLEAPK